jgi:hypothetical protein
MQEEIKGGISGEATLDSSSVVLEKDVGHGTVPQLSPEDDRRLLRKIDLQYVC